MMRRTHTKLLSVLSAATVLAGRVPHAHAQAPDAAAPGAAAPVVTPPELVEPVEAEYPPEALAAGTGATVELELIVDATGHVSDAKVVASGGAGFDEAALAAARRFVFVPARKDGIAIAARIRYRYVFEPRVAAPAPRTGRLTGRVLDRAGGAAVVGADVTITRIEGGEPIVATTDEDGAFAVHALAPGRYRVRVSAFELGDLSVEETVVAGEAVDATYRLDRLAPVTAAGEYGATARIDAPAREVTRRSIAAEELTRIPGTRGDALRTIELLPGVGRPAAGMGVLIVRGSAPGDSEVFMDGSSVLRLYHFGGLTSFANGELMDRIDLFPGNFSVRYGRRIGGIVEAGFRDPRRDRWHGTADLNLIDASLLVEGPLGERGSFAAAARRSTIDLWFGSAMAGAGETQVVAAPVYDDYQLVTAWFPTTSDRVRVLAYGSHDTFELVLAEPSDRDPTFRGDFGLTSQFHKAQVDWRRRWDDGEQTLQLTAGYFGNESRMSPEVVSDVDAFQLDARAEWRLRPHRRVEVTAGLDVQRLDADVAYRGPAPQQSEGNPELASPLDTQPMRSFGGRVAFFRPAAYAQAAVTLTEPLVLTAGVRADHFGDVGAWSIDPRVDVRYRDGGTTYKLAVGRFSQPPEYGQAMPALGNPALGPVHAVHAGGGVEHALSRRVSVGVEGFYKAIDGLIVNGAADGMLVNAGVGRIYGLEVAGRWLPGGTFSGFLSYTLSRSERDDDGDGDDFRLFDHDQTHILTASGSWTVGGGWQVGGTFRLVSGNPETPVVGATYDANTDQYRPTYGAINSTRNPLFHRVDVRVEKQFTLGGYRFAGYLDLQNAYNRRNREGTGYNFDFSQRQDMKGLPIIPSLGLRGEL